MRKNPYCIVSDKCCIISLLPIENNAVMNRHTHKGKRDEGPVRYPGEGDLKPHTNNSLHKLAIYILTSARTFLPFLTIPAMCISCTEYITDDTAPCEVILTKAEGTDLETLDLFFYDDDKQARLDAYQRFTLSGENSVHGISRTGRKTAVGICNFDDGKYTWTDINSLNSISSLKSFLDEDDPARPVMSGTGTLKAGNDVRMSMNLRPLMSEVVLRSVRCDFSSRTYRDEKLRDVRIYLTNVCSAWPVLKDTLSSSSDYINIGRADSSQISKMKHPEYIYRKLSSDIDARGTRPDLHFYCYPNVAKEESMGSPFTRIVIEGTLQGNKYYYPLSVNRRNDGTGVERNTVYVLDVVLTRRGTTDPDTAVDTETAQVSVTTRKWNEKDTQNVCF